MTPVSARVCRTSSVGSRSPSVSFVPLPRIRSERPAAAQSRSASAHSRASDGARGMERELAAARRAREDLARVREAERIEGALHAAHRGKVVRSVLERELAVLLHADAVLAGDGASRFEARAEDLDTRGLHALDDARAL